MKTIVKIKLLAALLIMTTVAATTYPAMAQRRSTQSKNTETQVKSNTRQTRTKTANKSAVKKNNNTRRKAVQSSSVRKQNTAPARNKKVTTKQKRTVKEPSATTNSRSTRSRTIAPDTRRRANTENQKAAEINSNRRQQTKAATNNRKSAVSTPNNRVKQGAEANRSTSERYNSSVRRSSVKNNASATRTRASESRKIYRLDTDDKRYTPNSKYRGSKNKWSAKRHAPRHVHYNRHDKKYYKNYNYRKYNHWSRKWERYRWNLTSWREYYSGYHPRSYLYHKHYYSHPRYGHVIRRFSYKPYVFVHNHNRYYSYNGHFFRYFRGIGYVLVDMPFGVVFEQLPANYQQVYINGYLYFRVGNLFFEMTQHGFSLVHYPERYYAYDDGYYNDGYYFNDNYAY